jgi:hypothetical protein
MVFTWELYRTVCTVTQKQKFLPSVSYNLLEKKSYMMAACIVIIAI